MIPAACATGELAMGKNASTIDQKNTSVITAERGGECIQHLIIVARIKYRRHENTDDVYNIMQNIRLEVYRRWLT
jgi:hypothetical protein